MQRLATAYRIGSSTIAAVALVVSNLLPLAGVVWWDWDLFTILTLYWVENGIVGVINVPKILHAEGSTLSGTWRMSLNGRQIESMARGPIAAFFALHYGGFWLGHGLFVIVALPVMTTGFTSGQVSPGADWGLVGSGAVALAISHAISYRANYLGRGEYRTASPGGQMMAPYGRLVILHVTIILGAALSMMIGSPVGSLLVLVSLKLVLDLFFHLREHWRLAAAAPVHGPS
ncbi:MAG TPA: DUF6498-containing protein [Candidatus Limnocylindria bacterium]|nr:DUF6498-containing protein [Candidatus Limnocylindria bacterium]